MEIEELSKGAIDHLVGLAMNLWPESNEEELHHEFMGMLFDRNNTCFLCLEEDNPLGFIHISTRHDYVEGSSGSPVTYIEGIYVLEGQRGKGVARKLLEAAEIWAKEQGCAEIASDCEIDKPENIEFHNKVGFKEVNRIACFIKEIK